MYSVGRQRTLINLHSALFFTMLMLRFIPFIGVRTFLTLHWIIGVLSRRGSAYSAPWVHAAV